MPSFSYKASTLEGKMVDGTMEAADDGTVALKLQEMGLIPVRIGSSSGKAVLSREFEWPWKRTKARRKDLLIFTQELHTLIRSGSPLDRSLAILSQLAESPAIAEAIQDVLREVKAGKSFSESLSQYPKIFPKVYVNMIKAGEAGGALEEILGRLTAYIEGTENLRSYIIGAMIYPALLSVVGLVSIIILTLFVIPRFTALFRDMGVDPPLAMRILEGFSSLLLGYWWFLLLLIIIAVYRFRSFRRSETGRLKWDHLLLRLPLVGKVLQKVEVARFSRTLGTLLHGGVPLLQGMSIVREIIDNQEIASAIEPIRNGIKKGEGIARPIRQSEVFPPLAMHLIEVGEESGKLDAMLVQVADIYDGEVRNSVKNLIAFFEPALILIMGIVIGTIVVSMLLAIFSINDIPL
jgi:general secretion pathway protein F